MNGASGKAVNSATWTAAAFWSAMKGLLGKVHIQKKVRALRIEATLALGDRRSVSRCDHIAPKRSGGCTGTP
jgi:hypothetical protein